MTLFLHVCLTKQCMKMEDGTQPQELVEKHEWVTIKFDIFNENKSKK